ncbi:hypothetical protein J6590_070600 [Homalodisca vitripennis]|nr:hypothetical protein J6590_070600 [Homalodisca vitripennis]
MSRHPCGICNIGVKYQAICCTGPCNMWYHSRCLTWSDKKFKKLTSEEISSWVCDKCKEGLETTKTDIGNLETKIQNLSLSDSLDHDTSLILAAEVGNALLSENLQLKEKLHMEKVKKSEYHLELEDKIVAKEELIKVLTVENNKLQVELRHLKNKLDTEHKLKNDLIEQAESEKSQFSKQVNDLLSCNSTLREKIKQIEGQIKLKTQKFDSLNKQNDMMLGSMKTLEEEVKIKTICEQARTAREHLEALFKASKPILNAVRSYKAENGFTNNTVLSDTLTFCMTGRTSQTPTQKLSLESTGRNRQTPTKKLSLESTGRASQTPTQKLSLESTGRISQTPTKKLNHNLTNSKYRKFYKNFSSKRSERTNFFSVSLQVSKKAAKSNLREHTLSAKSDVNQILKGKTKKPPMYPKEKPQNQSVEEFFTENIEYYLKIITKKQDHAAMHQPLSPRIPSLLKTPQQETPWAGDTSDSHQTVSPHLVQESGKQILTQADIHHSDSFLDHINLINSKIKTLS